MKKSTPKKKRAKLTPEQRKEAAQRRAKIRVNNAFKRKYKAIFKMAAFNILDTENMEFIIGHRKAELDCVFILENIIVICEDTTTSATSDIKEHILNKKEVADAILNNKEQFLSFLKKDFKDETAYLSNYEINELKFKFIYFSLNETNLTLEDKERFIPWYIVEPDILSYLYQCTIGLKKSVRYEVFRFLGITDSDFEITSSIGQGSSDVKVSIIYPQKSTGRKDGVRLVSFMLSAETLIRNSYVLRKDNWEESIGLYQRLIDLNKIKDIRNFLYQKGECFYNNIIVALPDGIKFTKADRSTIPIENITSFQNCTMHIPNKMNSICVIDGQHRIFAHYEGDENDPMEQRISLLRKQLHLLVTGLIFPYDMPQSERIKIQSDIFADINSKSKPIPPDVLLHIEMLRQPLSDISLARQVLERLNKQQLFFNSFEFSPLKPAKLKVASIIKFALRYLVSLTPGDNKESLYTIWENDKKQDIYKYDNVKEEYLDFCVKYIRDYFCAIKQIYSTQWNDPNSKMLSVIAFNSFILTLKKDLAIHGCQDREYYYKQYSKHIFDFSVDKFLYASSQYNKFSDEIIFQCFTDGSI